MTGPMNKLLNITPRFPSSKLPPLPLPPRAKTRTMQTWLPHYDTVLLSLGRVLYSKQQCPGVLTEYIYDKRNRCKFMTWVPCHPECLDHFYVIGFTTIRSCSYKTIKRRYSMTKMLQKCILTEIVEAKG